MPIMISSDKAKFVPNTHPDFEVPTVIPNEIEEYLNDDSGYFFDQNEMQTFELKIAGSSLEPVG